MEHDRLPDRVTIVEEYDDGTTISYSFKDLPLPADDPYVRRRQTRDGGETVSEIVSEFAAAPERPATYPPALPFVADRAVVTTESPDGSMSTGARWRCSDASALLERIVAASIDEGWTEVEETALSRATSEKPLAILRRGGVTRMLTKLEAPELSMVQLTDVAEP